jgi:hypothetical protein
MPERLVDVKTGEKVLHTFPVTISNRAAETGEDGFKTAANSGNTGRKRWRPRLTPSWCRTKNSRP